MSQETNLNVAPYFDDFDASNDYYKVLFKPGYPVQARELTGLQSILQNQIERFGQHFFKEGAKVIPGNTAYSNTYDCVQLENRYLGIALSDYASQLVGAKITGLTSGVTAVVNKIILADESDRGNTTLYVSYLGSNSSDNTTTTFANGELIAANLDIKSANTIIASGEGFATTIATNATATGSAFSITNGIYFAKGTFLSVDDETILLDQYGSTPTYRIGLLITEKIINADLDPSLNDNSKGFNNYAAPGADRLKITTSLHKKEITDFDDNNFIELATVTSGVLRSKRRTTDYNIIADELARRTYAESGDYYVKAFGLSVKESLNNNDGNNGVFNADQLTYGGATPSKDLALYKLSPGKAFVKGYEIETIAPTFLDVQKPRTTKLLTSQQINYDVGATIKLNRVYGAPTIGVGNTYIVSLRDSRAGASQTIFSGKEIGLARVYDFKLDSGSYDSATPATNEWDISLYDAQTFTEITVNEPMTLSVPTHIKGKYSGASAYIRSSVAAGTALTVYDVSGTFVQNENFVINGIEDPRVAIAVTSFGMGDVQSIFGNNNLDDGNVGAAATFSADCIPSTISNIGVATISNYVWSTAHGSISTVRSTSANFPGQIAVGNLLQFSGTDSEDPVLAKVVSLGSTHAVITGVTTVGGVASGSLPAALFQVADLNVVATNLSDSEDNAFYTPFPKANISNVDLTDASLTIRKAYTVTITDGQLSSSVSSGSNQTFLPFTPERYLLIGSDGATEPLTEDQVKLTGGSSTLQIYNLGADDADATLITTVKKLKPKAKNKIKDRVNTVVIDKSINSSSGIGSTTLNDGLTYGTYPYGTRVQDEDICLNVADIIEVHGIYESIDTSDPSAPTVTLGSISGPTGKTSDLIIGEKFVGQSSGASGIVLARVNDSKIEFVVKNQTNFIEGEVLVFEESNIQALVTTITVVSVDASFKYTFTTGQNSSFYNYGTLIRKSDITAPNRKLKAYFMNGYYESTDDGDITTSDSYSSFDFDTEIQTIDSNRNTDILDIRPKVSDYTVSTGARSPMEFLGRSFSGSGNSASNILASNEGVVTDYQFYLGRIDRIFLTKDGAFQVKYGTPAEKPEKPGIVDDAIEIASVTLPPYLYNVSNASKVFLEHKRYRMVDIKQLENRIKTLEYYTTLSLLETNTANLFVPDGAGLNRFKSGFFVDNFASLLAQEDGIEFNNSIDVNRKEIRPKHYTTAVDLIQGPVVGADPTADLSTTAPEGTNITKTGDIVTLKYTEQEWLKQTFATRTESVTPFLVSFWNGSLELTPATDTWTDTVRLEANIIQTEGNFAETLELATRTLNIDPQTGFSPTLWNSWETNWTGTEVVENTLERNEVTTTGGRWGQRGIGNNATGLTGGIWLEDRTTTVVRDTLREVRDTGVQTRTGTRTVVTEQFDLESVGDRVVSRNLISHMRSRNIQFVAKKVKPSTQLYAFFDGVNVTKFCTPKLVEITMVSGTFTVGETVTGTTRPIGMTPLDPDVVDPSITFRVATSNHKEGPYNAPTRIFGTNPYNGQTLPQTYSSTSTVLNVDTFSLANQPEGAFKGYISKDMILVGETSGAQATVSEVRLVSDLTATLMGTFFIPDPNLATNPKFEVGRRVLTFVNSAVNDQNNASTIAEEGFTAAGTLETVQEDIVSVRNARIENKIEFEEQAVTNTTGTQVISSEAISSNTDTSNRMIWYDPLAQSFLVEDDTGVYLTKCDVFFASKDDVDIPITFQLRSMQGGFPTQKILPFSEVILDPDQVNISADGSVATTITFKAPVYLEPATEYCIALASLSTKYSVYISRVGEQDLITQTFISNQPYLGSLFKSQNASTWEPSQWEDLKFTLYRADFVNNGTIEFYNPELTRGNKEIAHLLPNSLNVSSRKVRVGLGSTLQDDDLKLGNTFSQLGTNATGDYVGNAGIATGTFNIINAGVGYTPSSGTLQFDGVPLTNITSSGRDALADITVTNGVAVAATISSFSASSGGQGYVVGDVLGIGTIGAQSLGTGARLSLVSIANTNEIILDNVQGDFVVAGTAKTVQYVNNAGLTTDLNAAAGGNVQVSALNTDNDGLHIVVNHKNHGMYFNENYVAISNVKTDLIPTKLSVAYDATSTDPLQVDDLTNLGTFENVGVGTTNAGYIQIGEEVISYTEATDSTIAGTIGREVDETVSKNYPAGTAVYKYELGGVSLRRINKTHNLENVSVAGTTITFDSYNIKLDMGSSGVGRSTGESFPILYMGQTGSAGGSNIHATQNIPFEILTPYIQNVAVRGTAIDAQVRTVSSASISGSEIPYADQGYEDVSINKSNYLSTPRLIASKVNEDAKLTTLPGNKSMSLRVNLNTLDSRVSPIIDTQRVGAIFTSNRVNSVINNYITDNRVNTIGEDPTAFKYISKEIVLDNPATSIKILVDAYNNRYTAIRAFYAIGESENFNPIFIPFPGYNNLDEKGQIIDAANNDGLPDIYVPPSSSTGFVEMQNEFKENVFTVDELTSFRAYRIKLIMTSTNQVYAPKMRSLRVIALA